MKDIQSFLGFSNFYCFFIKIIPKKSLPSFVILKKDSLFIFNEKGFGHCQLLEESFNTAPILSHFIPSQSNNLADDASDNALGAVLSKVNDSGDNPIAFDSCNLLPDELNYEINDKELYGIVWALKFWRAFLLSLSHSFEVFTDHSSLKYFISSNFLTCCQARWAEFFSDFHSTITYFAGMLATLPDALSHWDCVYPERGHFISNHHQTSHQLLQKDAIQ
ncbi:hypothetical protein O181_026160 [Austropuccinia psidii MF-1]|uniref:Reverse transcriptase RNase H-like domain-containing protein n=1 Tax=Austropuccinia psidii MF-1 TaxID=1389203 RepID=A0A9Q3H1X0_9BASI|nr:hypothetical protein [Austropuccinia psidii MF-1]